MNAVKGSQKWIINYFLLIIIRETTSSGYPQTVLTNFYVFFKTSISIFYYLLLHIFSKIYFILTYRYLENQYYLESSETSLSKWRWQIIWIPGTSYFTFIKLKPAKINQNLNQAPSVSMIFLMSSNNFQLETPKNENFFRNVWKFCHLFHNNYNWKQNIAEGCMNHSHITLKLQRGHVQH